MKQKRFQAYNNPNQKNVFLVDDDGNQLSTERVPDF